MINLTAYDNFSVLNGHAIIGDWIAYTGEYGICTGKITGTRQVGRYSSGAPRDMMVLDSGDTEIPDNGIGECHYDVVKITPPCVNHCCKPSLCKLKGCRCRER
jgi:hypothetical protein